MCSHLFCASYHSPYLRIGLGEFIGYKHIIPLTAGISIDEKQFHKTSSNEINTRITFTFFKLLKTALVIFKGSVF
jgi:hypothetical protein